MDRGARDRARHRGARRLPLHRAPASASATPGSSRSRGRRSSAFCARRGSRSGCAPEGEATEVTLTSEEALRGISRLGSTMMRAPPGGASTRRWPGSSGCWSDERRRERERRRPAGLLRVAAGEVVGVGRPGEADPARRPRAGDAARRARRRRARPAGSSSTQVALPAPRPLPGGGRRRRQRGERAHRARAAGAPRGRAQLPRPRAPAKRRAQRRPRRGGHARAPPSRSRRCSRSACARGSRWSRSAAARASSAGSSRSPATHERVIALDLRRMRAGRRRPGLAHRDPRPRAARPRGRAGAAGPGPHPRPLPAVVRVRDHRRLRRHPLGRAGVGRLRALRRARHLAGDGHPERRAAHRSPRRTRRRGRRCASSRSARRACSARSPRSRSGCARRPRSAATRPGSPPTSPPAASSSARWPRRDALADVTRLSDEAETRVTLGPRADVGRASGRCSTPTCACGAAAAAAW